MVCRSILPWSAAAPAPVFAQDILVFKPNQSGITSGVRGSLEPTFQRAETPRVEIVTNEVIGRAPGRAMTDREEDGEEVDVLENGKAVLIATSKAAGGQDPSYSERKGA